MHATLRLCAATLSFCCAAGAATSPDAPAWPQFRGPSYDGLSAEKGALAGLGKDGPKEAWRASLGTGFTSITVVNGLAYSMGNTANEDVVSCFDAATGKLVWQHKYACQLDPKQFEGGPTATPTVSGGAVYTLSREGHVFCLDAKTGKPAWGRNLAQEVGAEKPSWGFSASPTVEGNLVFYNVGSNGTALDRKTGKVAWKTGGEAAGYASPVPFAVGKGKALAMFTKDALAAVNPANGQVLWKHAWTTNYGVNAADPLVIGQSIFISTGYGYGCALLDVSGPKPREVWRNTEMKNHFNGCVHLDGHLYGFDDSSLKCLEVKTGAVKWTQGGLGKGSLIAVDKGLVVLSERGELVIAEATPAAFKELTRTQVLSGKCWTAPVLCDGRIYCRNAKGDLVCLTVK